MTHVYKIDSHLPFEADGLRELIERIDPFYLTHELITNDRAEHSLHLDKQLQALEK